MTGSPPSPTYTEARRKFLGLSLESTRKSYYPQLKAQLSALRENEKRLRLLTDNLPAWISYVDDHERYRFVNSEYEQALCMPREAIIGRTMASLLGPENYDRVSDHIRNVLAGNRVRFETAFTTMAGERIWLEVNYVPYRDEGGAVIGFYDLTRDVTERKRAEDALRESEAQNRELIEHAPAGIFEMDVPRFRFTRVNPVVCFYTGYTEAELLDLDPHDLLSDASGEVLDGLVAALRSQGAEPPPTELVIRPKAGRELTVLVNIRVFMEDNAPRRIMAVAHDITAQREAEAGRKQLERKLQEAQKLEALGTLAGGIAHDFNNLLMGIQGNASLAMLNGDPGSEIYQRLKNIETHVQRGADLTRQLLGLARGGKYEVRSTALNQLVRESAEMFGRTKKEITIEHRYAEGLWTVDVDRGQIEQVLLNLFINAWHAMPDGGTLAIATRNVDVDEKAAVPYEIEPGRYVCVSVADTGCGIAPETRRKIFDPFFTTKRVGKGSGLGLASAYGIIKNHQGAIDVASELGRGSTFYIYLPASTGAVQPDSDDVQRPAMGSETILLVDDESIVLDVGEKMLESLGYRVITAGSGEAALAAFGRQADGIDLVIMDMVMPQMGGRELFDGLKTLDPEVKVLLSSGYSIDGQASSIIARGCRGFIQKPFSVNDLAAKIREVI